MCAAKSFLKNGTVGKSQALADKLEGRGGVCVCVGGGGCEGAIKGGGGTDRRVCSSAFWFCAFLYKSGMGLVVQAEVDFFAPRKVGNSSSPTPFVYLAFQKEPFWFLSSREANA